MVRFLGVTEGDSGNTESRAAPTVYAAGRGAWTRNVYLTAEGVPSVWWWLRSPGDDQLNAARVFNDGSLDYYDVDSENGTVRPALWLDVAAGGF